MKLLCFAILFAGQLWAASDRPIVVVISIDGFPAYALDDPHLPAPTLRRLMKEGASAGRMSIINPTVTWPNHTTMVTGVDARKHGVLFNGLLDRDVTPPKLEPWIEKEKLVRAPTVYDALYEAGLTTAQVDWPAIYNAKTITWQFPERPDPDGVIEREMQAQGLFTRQDASGFTHATNPAWRDQMWTDAAAYIIKQHKPNLMLFHLLNLDGTHHEYGPLSTASFGAIALADSRVQKILDTIQGAGLKDRTTVIVVSDHGFKTVKKVIRIANIVPEGGTAMVYRTKADRDAGAKFQKIEGIDRVVEPKDYAALGLPSPSENRQSPDLLLIAKDGYAFTTGDGATVVTDAHPGMGAHGYVSTDPDMDAIFIAWGRGIRPGAHLDRIRNIDVAPTIASLLGIQFPSADGRSLTEFLAPN